MLRLLFQSGFCPFHLWQSARVTSRNMHIPSARLGHDEKRNESNIRADFFFLMQDSYVLQKGEKRAKRDPLLSGTVQSITLLLLSRSQSIIPIFVSRCNQETLRLNLLPEGSTWYVLNIAGKRANGAPILICSWIYFGVCAKIGDQQIFLLPSNRIAIWHKDIRGKKKILHCKFGVIFLAQFSWIDLYILARKSRKLTGDAHKKGRKAESVLRMMPRWTQGFFSLLSPPASSPLGRTARARAKDENPLRSMTN